LGCGPLLQELISNSGDFCGIWIQADVRESSLSIPFQAGLIVAKNGSEIDALQQFLRHWPLGIGKQQRLKEQGRSFTRQRTEKNCRFGC